MRERLGDDHDDGRSWNDQQNDAGDDEGGEMFG